MLDQPTPADDLDLAAQAADDAQFFRAVLHEIINIGVDHLRIGAEHAKSRAADGQADPDADSIAYDRVTRSVRRSIMLAQQVTDPAATARAVQQRLAARERILRDVEDTIHREVPEKPEREALQAELLDRLDRPDLLEAIDIRPIREIIDDIVRDLGLAAHPGASPYKRRTPADIDLLCARAARQPRPQPAPHSAPDPERIFRLVATPIQA